MIILFCLFYIHRASVSDDEDEAVTPPASMSSAAPTTTAAPASTASPSQAAKTVRISTTTAPTGTL